MRLILLAAFPLLAFHASAQKPLVTEDALRRHIDVLASDAFEGRKPGTAGETRTLEYLTRQLAALGLEPGGENGSWYQAVPLVSARPFAHRAQFSVNGSPVEFVQDDILLIGKEPVERLADAPVWLVGGASVQQIAGVDIAGGIALLTYDAKTAADHETRSAAARKAGASAVLMVLGDDMPWTAIRDAFGSGRDQLQSQVAPGIRGAMPGASAARLVDPAQLAAASSADFRPVRLPVQATLDVSTQVNAYNSHNVIGRLRGSGRTDESIMYLGHWDHLGICRPEGAADRICNGAVDNASGLAMMIETARHLSKGSRPARDVLFLGTTAEESGLIGAEYFGANPTVPADKIVAAINIDTVAIAPRGEPVAIVGRGTTPLDPIVDATSRELGRQVDADLEANAFVQRQDGYELTKAGIPTVMVGGSFSNMTKLGAFLSGPYHKPEDDLSRPIELGGAAEDTDLMIALGRKLADPRQYRPQPR